MRHWAEQVACEWLERRGWRRESANAHVRGGELDLVMRDGPVLVAVEVRQRRGASFGGAAASLTRGKLRRVRRAARLWALEHYGRENLPMRVDAVLVTGTPRAHRVEHLPDVG